MVHRLLSEMENDREMLYAVLCTQSTGQKLNIEQIKMMMMMMMVRCDYNGVCDDNDNDGTSNNNNSNHANDYDNRQ